MKDRAEQIKQKLLKTPELMDRIDSILDIATDPEGHLVTADAAEERTKAELQKLGQELLHQWTAGKSEAHALRVESSGTNRKSRKKNSIGKVSTVALK